ncbi:MAG TPA: hypothetical protein VFL13_00970 [Candidatus Baltobacteraceae bacterium]|nr:hypothetical protein [Candidatus Baltobacteraceae bacterium]
MPLRAAGFSVLAALLAACGGGGGATTQSAAVVPVSGITQPASSGGPVAYMQTSGFSSSGSITKGSSSAIVAIMSGDASAQESYQADTFTVSSSAPAAASAVRTAHIASAPEHPHAIEAFPADDSALLSKLALQRTNAAPAPAPRRIASIPANPAVGTQSSIWVQQGGYAGRSNVQVPATLVAQSAHGNIWAQSTLVSQLSGNEAQLTSAFENAYASDTANFASADYSSSAPGLQPQYTTCSSSGAHQGTAPAYISEPSDKRINVMIVDSSTLGGLGGYFTGANFMTQGSLNCLGSGYESNQAPFIFVGWFSSYGLQYELREDYVRSTAHELQHLINFVNHSLLASAASSASYNGNESQYVNEGLSMLAQDFAVQRLYGAQFDSADALQRAKAYLANPGAFSVSGFSGIDSPSWGGNGSTAQTNCSGGCYGGTYLLMRYLRDRFGASFTHGMETSGTTGAANLQTVTGESAGNLMGDFALAMAAATLNVAPSDQRFAFGTLNLHGSYTDQFGSTLTLDGLNATPAGGSATAVNAPVGGFGFVLLPSVPSSGMNVQVTDQATVGGFSLQGGLAQH